MKVHFTFTSLFHLAPWSGHSKYHYCTVTYEDGQAGREALVAKTEDEAKRPLAGSHTLIPRPSNSPPVNPSPERSAISSHVVGGTVSDDTLNNSNLPNISLAPTSSSTPNRSSVRSLSFQFLIESCAIYAVVVWQSVNIYGNKPWRAN